MCLVWRGLNRMIQLYMWGTPNGYKVSIMLEEVGLPYTVCPGRYREGRAVRARIPREIIANNRFTAIVDAERPGRRAN